MPIKKFNQHNHSFQMTPQILKSDQFEIVVHLQILTLMYQKEGQVLILEKSG